MGLFNKPEIVEIDNGYGIKVLFLHGLEGSAKGKKGTYLLNKWGAVCPPLRTLDLIEKRDSCNGNWKSLDQSEKDAGLALAYTDAVNAVRYAKPDVIIGSSMGAAILFKMLAEEKFEGTSVLCAPAIENLLEESTINKAIEKIKPAQSIWLLAELDDKVSNSSNLRIATKCKGSIMFSPSDSHRLEKAIEKGLLDAAILTGIELFTHINDV
jgi:hypothetical protein